MTLGAGSRAKTTIRMAFGATAAFVLVNAFILPRSRPLRAEETTTAPGAVASPPPQAAGGVSGSTLSSVEGVERPAVTAPSPTPTPTPAPAATPASALAPETQALSGTPSDAPTPTAMDYKKFRDPFQQQADAAVKNDKRSELERYSTSDFKLTGVITGPLKMRAILVAPNGKSFIVNEGIRIGSRDGWIKKITTKSVLVEEKQVNELGEIEKSDQEISLDTELESK